MTSLLKGINLHLWTLVRIHLLLFRYMVQSSSVNGLEAERKAAAELVHGLLAIALPLSNGSPDRLPRWRRRIWLFARTWEFQLISMSVTFLVPQSHHSDVADRELQQIVELSKTALDYYESGGAEVIERARWWFGRILLRQLKCIHRAVHHVTLATAYLRTTTGDLARNLETAFAHYRDAVEMLEAENIDTLSFYAVALRLAWAKALLEYPTEHRKNYVAEAIAVLIRAEENISHYHSKANPRGTTLFQESPTFAEGFAMSMHVAWGGCRMTFTGRADPFLLGAFLPLLGFFVNAQLAIVYRQHGECDKAITCADRAIAHEIGEDSDSLSFRANVEVEKGFAYLESRAGDRGKNVLLAIKSFNRALGLCVFKRGIRRLALKAYVLSLIGDAEGYRALQQLGRVKVETHKKQLPVLTNQLRQAARTARMAGMREKVYDALFLLGQVYAAEKDHARAYRALAVASRVAASLERRTRTQRLRRYRTGYEAPLYELLVPIALKYATELTEKPAKRSLVLDSAFNFAERGRTNLLQSELAGRTLPLGARPADVERLFALRRQYQYSELRLLEQESTGNVSRRDVSDQLRLKRNDYERQYLEELKRVRAAFRSRTYDPDRPIAPVTRDKLHSTVCSLSQEGDTALVEYFISNQGLQVFVVLPTEFNCVRLEMSRSELDSIRELWESALHVAKRVHPTHWENGYLRRALEGLKLAAYYPAEVIRDWEREEGRRVQRVILIPHRFLHLLPFHAIPIAEGQRWGDTVAIHYAPSGAILRRLARRRLPAASEVDKTVAIAYSVPVDVNLQQSLLFHREETLTIKTTMHGEVLQGEKATPETVKEIIAHATHVHISCHGIFESTNPLDSALVLAQNGSHGKLTLGEIFENVHLPRTRLVVLSACETGITKAERFHDEYIGMPAGFLYAGAKTVVSTLWRVPDVATWLLMRSFWSEIKSGTRPGEALRRASCALRSLSLDEVRGLIAVAAAREENPAHREAMEKEGQKLQGERPFASPYWWAGFTVNGLG